MNEGKDIGGNYRGKRRRGTEMIWERRELVYGLGREGKVDDKGR